MKLQVGVKVLVQNESGEFLFLRRDVSFRPGAPQKWDIPGGRINPDESLMAALGREVKEETGMSLESADELLAAQDIFVDKAEVHVVRLTYRGKATGDVKLSDEHDAFKWMKLDEILSEEYIDSYLVSVLRSIKNT